MKIIEEDDEKRVVEHGGKEYNIDKTPAISVVGTKDADHCHVTISHNIISQDGFEPLTKAVKQQTRLIFWAVLAFLLQTTITVYFVNIIK